jgi:hypothetical protein
MLAEILLSCCASFPVALPALSPLPPLSVAVAFANTAPVAACVAPPDSLALDGEGGGDGDGAPPPIAPVLPAPARSRGARGRGVEWRRLGADSLRFVAIMHGFRWATEAGTRSAGIGLGSGYLQSLGNLHGWADGDPFYVNYVGHPMQGAVSGRIFLLSDPRYGRTEFGKDPDYWKGKLRAAAFSWAFSEQFEIGLLSEASIGHIQRDFPQQGFVDHVVTPSVGLMWMIGEDALDRHVVRAVEDRVRNPWLRMGLRVALNPARSMANLMDMKVPWYRLSRAGVVAYAPAPKGLRGAGSADRAVLVTPEPKAPTFEFSMSPGLRQFAGGPCMGGGAEAAYRVAPDMQVVLAVNGCKLLGMEKDLSGDALVYQVGPRWKPDSTGRWSPYAQLLVGGMKVTHEQFYPDKKLALEELNKGLDPMLGYTLHDQYTRHEEASGVAISAGTGVDYKLNEALAIRVASIEYLRSSVERVGGMSYGSGLQVTTGMVLRLGTW